MECNATAVLSFSITLAAGIVIFWYFNRNKKRVPKKWEPVGTVTKLFLYPLKGGRRVELDHVACTKKGFIMPKDGSKYQFKDRNLICYREQNLEYWSGPKMQLVEVKACDDKHFILSAPNIPSLRVKIPDAIYDKDKKGKMLFWTKENVSQYDCGDDAARWISRYGLDSDSGVRLGFFDNNFERNIQDSLKKDAKYFPNLKNEASGLFSNITSYMVVNQASVDDICSKLPDEVITANNFRPNILVQDKNLAPFAEDHWKWIKIGNVILYAVIPCLRCEIITVNPETGIKSEKQEPLRTLRKYRKLKDVMNLDYKAHSVVFGKQMGLEHEGHIKVGDTVFIGE